MTIREPEQFTFSTTVRRIKNLDLAALLPDEPEDTPAHLKAFPERAQIEFIVECGLYYAQATLLDQEEQFLHEVYSRFHWQYPVELSPSSDRGAYYSRLRIKHQLNRVMEHLGDWKPRNEWSTVFSIPRDHTKAFARFQILNWQKAKDLEDEECAKKGEASPATSSEEASNVSQDSDAESSSANEQDGEGDEDKDESEHGDEDGEGEDDDSGGEDEDDSEAGYINPGDCKDHPLDLTLSD